MNDSVIVAIAGVVAVIGLLLLLLTKPGQEDGFVLKGTLIEAGKTKGVLEANISVVGKNLSKGKFEEKVFWSDGAFIVLR